MENTGRKSDSGMKEDATNDDHTTTLLAVVIWLLPLLDKLGEEQVCALK